MSACSLPFSTCSPVSDLQASRSFPFDGDDGEQSVTEHDASKPPSVQPASARGRRLLEACASALGAASDLLEEYAAMLAMLEEERLRGGDPRDDTFGAWLEGQLGRVHALMRVLEDTVLDDFLRIADRNVRIKHYEDGEFV